MVHVVVVDDSPADQALVARAFREAFQGADVFELHAFENGERVLDYLVEKIGDVPPDLLVLDLNPPGKHGLEVLNEIKSHPVLQCIPVVLFSTSPAGEVVGSVYGMDRLHEVIENVKRYWQETSEPCRVASR